MELEIRCLFEDGEAVFFGATGVGGGFVDDVVPFFEGFPNGGGSADQGLQVGNVVFVHGGGYGYDREAGLFEDLDVIGEDDIATLEFFGVHFLTGVDVVSHHFNAAAVDVEADHGDLAGKFECDGQAHIATA